MTPKKKTGPKSPWDESLGITLTFGYRCPGPVKELIYEEETKILLNRMAIDPPFKKEILNQVPNRSPHAPKTLNADTDTSTDIKSSEV